MRVDKTTEGKSSVQLVINADSDDLTPVKNHVLSHFSAKVKVPGFRLGVAPIALLEKHINQQELADEFLEHALNQLYSAAIDQLKLRPASKPEINLKKFVPFTTLEFEANFDIIGSIKLPDYKKIKLSKKPADVTSADVGGVIKSLQQRMAQRVEVGRPAKKGDELTINFSGKNASGEPLPGADGKDFPLLLGSGTFIPGFEDKLIGSKAGDKKIFTIIFPKDYGAAGLRGKPVTFNVEVKKVSDVVEPNVDGVFAAKVGPFKTVAELKADIKKQLAIERQQQADRAYENDLIQEISSKSSVDVPKVLVDDQIERMEQEERQNITYRGQTWQEHLDEEGVNDSQHKEQKRPQAEERMKASLIMAEIAEVEGLEVTPDEIDLRLQLLKGQYQDPQMQAELDKPEARRDIAGRLLTEKTLEKVVGYATK